MSAGTGWTAQAAAGTACWCLPLLQVAGCTRGPASLRGSAQRGRRPQAFASGRRRGVTPTSLAYAAIFVVQNNSCWLGPPVQSYADRTLEGQRKGFAAVASSQSVLAR